MDRSREICRYDPYTAVACQIRAINDYKDPSDVINKMVTTPCLGKDWRRLLSNNEYAISIMLNAEIHKLEFLIYSTRWTRSNSPSDQWNSRKQTEKTNCCHLAGEHFIVGFLFPSVSCSPVYTYEQIQSKFNKPYDNINWKRQSSWLHGFVSEISTSTVWNFSRLWIHNVKACRDMPWR